VRHGEGKGEGEGLNTKEYMGNKKTLDQGNARCPLALVCIPLILHRKPYISQLALNTVSLSIRDLFLSQSDLPASLADGHALARRRRPSYID
jgi:hypothetical protein